MIKLICFYLIFVGNRKIENETLFLRIITFNYGLILFLFKRTAMEKLLNENFIREITPLSDKDCFYIADRHKKEFTYPMHCHREFELNFVEHAPGVRRVVGDSAEVIGDYDLVLITSPDLEHVWEQNTCTSENIREITIQFVPSFMNGLMETKKEKSSQSFKKEGEKNSFFISDSGILCCWLTQYRPHLAVRKTSLSSCRKES